MKQVCCRHPRASRGIGALVEIIVVAVIILVAMSFYFSMNGRGGGSNTDAAISRQLTDIGIEQNGGASSATTSAPVVHRRTTLPGQAMDRGEDTKCKEYLKQLRELIMIKQMDGENPSSLAAVSGSAAIRKCPAGGEYQYDAGTAAVHCTTPGHERY